MLGAVCKEAEGHSNSCEQCSVDAVTTRVLKVYTHNVDPWTVAYSLHDTKIRTMRVGDAGRTVRSCCSRESA